ncbi:Hsp20/alpha crystallin family protein [Niabella sp. CC-SYL272]|uniref:Hsp20/alpha crystallin family protein n=1 Tax=Niabella agricola TaxID=2891571 RepID=UPI001F411E6C|nr:Hsp20/alpha crystallin family protein [Niabella agricola]MCF3108303.1 Hsp20/alpha crystallin family protein [Niabella agricola]
MKTDHLRNEEQAAYPGGFVPAVNAGSITEILQSVDTETIPPRVNITELKDGYKIDLEAPGLKKENFIIQANKQILTIFAENKNQGLAAGTSYRLHEFNNRYLYRDIVLPPDVSTLFFHIQYDAGILTIHLCKTTGVPEDAQTTACVY